MAFNALKFMKFCTKSLITGQVLHLENSVKYVFIALIHPIQWTIANPVGADRSAKCQEKTSSVSTGRSVTFCAFARWRIVLPSCLDKCDVIASFSFGACSLQTEILEIISK